MLRSFASRFASVDVKRNCAQSTLLAPTVQRGELGLALRSRDRPPRGVLLFTAPLV